MSDKPKNRGRIQAQGGGIEESESWACENPPTWEEGIEKLEKLREKLSKSEQKNREKLFDKAERFIKAAGEKNGVSAPVSKKFQKKGSKDVRIDIEVIVGIAFVSITALIIFVKILL